MASANDLTLNLVPGTRPDYKERAIVPEVLRQIAMAFATFSSTG